MNPSGVRLGTPAITTRGLKEAEMKLIVSLMDKALINKDDDNKLAEFKEEIKKLCAQFPIPTK
jgi:glycine hydroxymethyltransferase